MTKRLLSYFKYLMPWPVFGMAFLSFTQHGWICFMPVFYAFVLMPFAELFIKPDETNLTEAEEAIAAKDIVFDILIYLILPLQYGALIFFLFSFKNYPSADMVTTIGRITSMGLLCGVFGINVGHELGHRKNKFEQWLAKLLLLTSLYTHFFIEHNKGHHKNVSTPNDPSSARYNEPIYLFYLRTISGTYKGAWHISLEEDKKYNRKFWQNEMLHLQILQIFLLFIIAYFFGWQILVYYLFAAVMGFLLLETVNYIEHYGLSRKQLPNGKYERALPIHSWNSNHILGRLTLFELSRHSDHHYLASRKYQILRNFNEAPQLPTGYPGSMLLAMFPPLWFKIMNKRIKQLELARTQ